MLITNLSDNEKKSGDVIVDIRNLDVARNSKMKVLNIKGTVPESVETKGGKVRIKNLPSLSFAAILIE